MVTSFWYLWQCEQVPSPAGKWNQHLHKACQQKEAWSALKFPGRWLRWLWTSENTVDQHQQMTWQPKSSLTVEISHWTSSNMDSVPLHSSSRLWDLDFQIKCKINYHLKRGLWTTEQQSSSFFSLAQVRCFWRCFCFRSGLVALFLKMSERWLLMHWLQLQFTPCEALPSVWMGFHWQYSQACGHPCCLCTFSNPISSFQSTLHLICFDTALLEQPPPFSIDPLWLTFFVKGVNDRFLDHCQVSSVPHYCAFKEQEMPRMYTVWMVIYWNSNVNILIFWDTDFWLSLAVSSNNN